MKWRALLILFLATAVASAAETEIIPCQSVSSLGALPTCCLKGNETEYVLYRGDEVLQRFRHSFGANFVGPSPVFDTTLNLAVDTLLKLRKAGACR